MPEPEFIPADPDNEARRSDPARNLAVAVYILQGLALFIGGLSALAGVVINYVKLDDVRNTWIEAHFRWQIRTFWLALAWTVVGIITLFILVGWFILLGTAIWFIYRVVRGALALNDGRAP
ncbi:hypothetical protein [uncultured Marinobacter sp.]|uniref:DUF4870 family protein n=1 Tax=uncultured Marinobacter sp. TaxID=187379 RepID=UPI0030DA0318